MKHRHASSAPTLDIDDATGREWAAQLQEAYGPLALVLWEVAGRHLTAFWRGPSPEGFYVKARTPQDLRAAVTARLGELRLAASVPVQHPIVHEILPGLQRRRR
jgi:hypothetical protein